MAIYRLIAIGTFGPDEIKAMAAAYEGTLIFASPNPNDVCSVMVNEITHG
jgi:hypothetical protein